MTASNWAVAFPATLEHEGGYVDHPADPGGATNLGATIGAWSDYIGRPATKAEIRALTPSDVRPFYKRKYWDVVRGDDLPSGVDYVTYDAAVNSGPSRGVKWTQRAVGVAQDGKVGPLTLAALAKATAADVIKRATDYRLGFLQSLRTWGTFGKGWARRVGGVRALGLELDGASRQEIVDDANELEDASKEDKAGAGAVGTGSAGSAGGASVVDLDWTWIVGIGGVVVALAVVALILYKRGQARREAAVAVRSHAQRMPA